MQERLIRYPAAQLYDDEEESASAVDTLERSSDWWGIERYYELSSDEEDENDLRAKSQRTASTSGRAAAKETVQVLRCFNAFGVRSL